MESLSATSKRERQTRLLNPWMIVLVALFVIALLTLFVAWPHRTLHLGLLLQVQGWAGA